MLVATLNDKEVMLASALDWVICAAEYTTAPAPVPRLGLLGRDGGGHGTEGPTARQTRQARADETTRPRSASWAIGAGRLLRFRHGNSPCAR